jgi:exonuclease III
MAFSVATWNVNSLKIRLTHLTDWLALHPSDIVCLQETKLADENFPPWLFSQRATRVCSPASGPTTAWQSW